MAIRTFYWDPLQGKSRWQFALQKAFGKSTAISKNAGDAFNLDLIAWKYNSHSVQNISDEGSRLLLVGSIAHRMLDGDIICGIGSKNHNVPYAREYRVNVYGLRGPLTLKAFKDAGHDLSKAHFLGDPGLLIAKVYPDLLTISSVRNRVSFIPHYRERFRYRNTKNYSLIDIDNDAYAVAKKIREAEFLYTSSLHGLIWAHALGRPAMLVAPQDGEDLFKYKDYFLSISQNFSFAKNIEEAIRARKSTSPIDVENIIDSITLPRSEELKHSRIIT